MCIHKTSELNVCTDVYTCIVLFGISQFVNYITSNRALTFWFIGIV